MGEVLTLTIDKKIRIMRLAVEMSNVECTYVDVYKMMIDLIVNYEPERVAIIKQKPGLMIVMVNQRVNVQ